MNTSDFIIKKLNLFDGCKFQQPVLVVQNGNILRDNFIKDKLIGCYLWVNILNNKCYIGRSINVKDRILTEYRELTLKSGGNLKKLFNAVKKYGIQNFNVYQITFSDKENVIEQEVELIKLFDSKNNGYNCNFGGTGNTGHSVSNEQIQKQKESLSKYWTKERKIQHSLKMKEFAKNNPNSIQKMKNSIKEKFNTAEMKKKISDGIKRNLKAFNKRIKNHSNKMKEFYKNNPHIAETHSARMKEYYKKHEPHNVKTFKIKSPDGVIMEIKNIANFCRDYGFKSTGTMCSLLSGKKKSYNGWVLPETPLTERKSFKIKSPTDEIHEFKNVKEFCDLHGLKPFAIRRVLNGKRPHYKGWKLF